MDSINEASLEDGLKAVADAECHCLDVVEHSEMGSYCTDPERTALAASELLDPIPRHWY